DVISTVASTVRVSYVTFFTPLIFSRLDLTTSSALPPSMPCNDSTTDLIPGACEVASERETETKERRRRGTRIRMRRLSRCGLRNGEAAASRVAEAGRSRHA